MFFYFVHIFNKHKFTQCLTVEKYSHFATKANIFCLKMWKGWNEYKNIVYK